MNARAQIVVSGRISEVEALWYDHTRWASFIDGFHHVVKGLEGWPAQGTLIWDSTPGGRGRVIERVTRYEPRIGQVVEVEDESITGHQSIAFKAHDDERVMIVLELSWDLKQKGRGPVAAVVNAVFIRPRQREALQRTLARFSRELASDRTVGRG